MAKANIKNERIKRKFFDWLKEANGRCDSTLLTVEKAIWLYEDFTKGADLATFSTDKAVAFKRWLAKRKGRDSPIAVSTYHGYVRHLRQFFKWLSQQPGYKSRITPDMADYLKLSEKDERMARQTTPRSYPPLDHIVTLVDTITVRNEIDLRDRALISFTLISAMRDKAIVTLPIGCFNKDTLTVDQDPRKGVQTKFSKAIRSVLFPFDDKLLDNFLQWYAHLQLKGFGSQAPLFPRSKVRQGPDGLSFETPTEIEPCYWKGTGGMREIFKRRSENAGLLYYPPHSYRHLAADLAIKTCRTGEQIKAVSQNLGHEHVATTLSAYGTLDPVRLSRLVRSLKPNKINDPTDEKFKKIQDILST